MAQFDRLAPRPIVVNLGATVAAGTPGTWALGKANHAGEIVAAEFTNGANLASDAVNYTTIAVLFGTNTAASITNNGTALTANTPASMVLSTTAANRRFAAGDVIKITKTDTGTGAAVTAQAFVTLWVIPGYETGSTPAAATGPA